MKKDKIIILSLVTLIGTSSILNEVSYTVFAQENTNIDMKNQSKVNNEKVVLEDNEKNTPSSSTENKAVKTIYVKTATGNGGVGTEESPYSDFKVAYSKANEGDTIVLLNSVTIQNDDYGLDSGVFTFNKSDKLLLTKSASTLPSGDNSICPSLFKSTKPLAKFLSTISNKLHASEGSQK